ncbi:hypothetical protein [Nitrosospira sp. Nsp2]
MIYAAKPDAFDDEERRLLVETASAVALASPHYG